MKLFQLIFVFCFSSVSTELVALDDKSWMEMLSGEWMVEFYAPWCPSCQNFESVWKQFAEAMKTKNVRVGAIDIDRFPSFSGRFGISVLPTIYHVHNGNFRYFKGSRSLENLKNFIEKQEWNKTEPVSSYFAPNSFLMSVIGSIFDVSLFVKEAYTTLHTTYDLPSWLIYLVLSVGVIFVGLIIGFVFLMLLDYCLSGFSKEPTSGISNDSDVPSDSSDSEDEKLIISKKSKKNSPISSTPRPKGKNGSKSAKLTSKSEQDEEEEEEEENENPNQFNESTSNDDENQDGEREIREEERENSNFDEKNSSDEEENQNKRKNLRQRRK